MRHFWDHNWTGVRWGIGSGADWARADWYEGVVDVKGLVGLVGWDGEVALNGAVGERGEGVREVLVVVWAAPAVALAWPVSRMVLMASVWLCTLPGATLVV